MKEEMEKVVRNESKSTKVVFQLTVAAALCFVFIYNFFTPMMTDDLFYANTVSGASSLWDLLLQEYNQYMTWTGRSVCHMLVRIFLSMDKMVFNVANSLVFVLLTLLIYWNVEGKKKYDTRVYILINLLIWMFGVMFRQTVLWETGACNYLWGTAIIMSFVTLYRYGLKKEQTVGNGENRRKFSVIMFSFGLFLLGILAGWCNENTSGGGILLTWCSLGFFLLDTKQKKAARVSLWQPLKPWMVIGLIGQLIGFLFMVLAPGNMARASVREEEHSGLFAYVSRFQKINLAIYEEFLILLIILLIFVAIVWHQTAKREKDTQFRIFRKFCQLNRNGLLWTVVFFATCFALILTTEPMRRAYFGAGVILIVAVVQFFVSVEEDETIFASLKTGMVAVMLMIMFFTYMDCGANMIRIYREYNERDVYLTQKAEEGVKDVTIPMLRPDFENKYSDGYNSDIQEDPGYWINVAYATYYGFDSVSGVPREEWTEY